MEAIRETGEHKYIAAKRRKQEKRGEEMEKVLSPQKGITKNV